MKKGRLSKIKSIGAKYREKHRREKIINWEIFKTIQLPFYIFGGMLISAVLFFVIGGIFFLQDLEEEFLVPLILAVQAAIIIIQLWFIRNQTRFIRMGHQPEFVLEAKPHPGGRCWMVIYVQNLGSTAHRVKFKIIPKKGEKLTFLERHNELYTFKTNEKKNACEIDKKDFKEKQFRIELEYLDKLGYLGNPKFLKLLGEEDFETLDPGFF